MFLIVANADDRRAPGLVEQWSSVDARVLSTNDLGCSGWSHEPAHPLAGRAVVAGEVIEVGRIDGVCTLMPCVFESELAWIRAEDRAYVAVEMTAFLCAWLSALPCTVVNQVHPSCLCGLPWGAARWRHLALQEGLPVLADQGPTAIPGAPAAGGRTTATVVGNTVFGTRTEAQSELASELAARSGLPLLRVQLAGSDSAPVVAGADPWIETGRAGAAQAILELMLAHR